MKFAVVVFFLLLIVNQSNNVNAKSYDGEPHNFCSGVVVDQITGEALAGVSVKLEGFDKEYYTDFEGKFIIDAPESGLYNLLFSYTSYSRCELKNVRINNFQSSDLLIKLKIVN